MLTLRKVSIFGLFIFLVALLAGCTDGAETTQTENEQMTQETETQTDENTESDFSASIDYKITGIEPGAGIMINSEKAMESYGLNETEWQLQESSSAAMLAAMQDALQNEEPIIATLWEPHAVFSIGDIRKLEDPQNIYNSPEQTKEFLAEYAPEWADRKVASDVIASVVYKGFSEDAPAAYQFFQKFNVPSDTQSEWIYKYSIEDMDAEEIAEQFMSNNPDLVTSWVPENADLGKETITIGIPPWPGATVKSRVVAAILEDIGYSTEIKELDVGVVYTSIAQKDIDVNVAGWLPTTHQEYWDSMGDKLEIAGVNILTTWLGLGVPAYVDPEVQSLEDLANL